MGGIISNREVLVSTQAGLGSNSSTAGCSRQERAHSLCCSPCTIKPAPQQRLGDAECGKIELCCHKGEGWAHKRGHADGTRWIRCQAWNWEQSCSRSTLWGAARVLKSLRGCPSDGTLHWDTPESNPVLGSLNKNHSSAAVEIITAQTPQLPLLQRHRFTREGASPPPAFPLATSMSMYA